MGYSLYMMAYFQNGLVSRIFSLFWGGFLYKRTLNIFVECIFTCFLEFLYRTALNDL